MKKQLPDISHIRHSLAHLLAASILELYPGSKNAIGPAIDDGFYQDLEIQGQISDSDLQKIENKMRQILKTWKKFTRREVTPAEARKQFAWNKYKLELIDELEKKGEKISLYTSGNFIDLCRGGHSEDASEINPQGFKLSKTAGAYWRGDANNKMLTRIYGFAFHSKEELEKHTQILEEAKKRDHKKLGAQLDLFTFSDLIGQGLPLWTPKGTLIRELLNDFVWKLRKQVGFSKVEIPHITKKELYQTSGHWDKFKDELFRIKTREGHEFAMKPMNCPHHTQIYAHLPRSYRELPQRYANTTMVYRDEQTGELNGLTRVRSITQDDAHVFARHDQVQKELLGLWNVVQTFYKALGFKDFQIRLSFSDPEQPEKYLGSKENWKKAESTLENFVKLKKANYFIAPGEAAFYGPKIDFITKDWAGRAFQIATIQLDYVMPERFGLDCINEKGEKEPIVMMHCAVMGSIERCLAMLLEHYAGWFPVWLAPVQIKLLPISKKQNKYAAEVAAQLTKIIPDLRFEIDSSDESVGKKIRSTILEKIPYSLILGEKEMKAKKIAVRKKDKDLGILNLKKFAQQLAAEIELKTSK